jgi:DNA polymerase-3 subunit delta'
VFFSKILRQERAKRFLKQVIAREKIPHAYLFTGIPGIGKTSTAMALTMALNCDSPVDGDGCGRCPSCRKMIGGNFPDFVPIKVPPDRNNILIEQIRDLNRELSFAPHGKYRVCVIYQAKSMTDEAANSFLKTLEEPPPGNILILNAKEPRNLLPTIVSRCQRVAFQPLPIKDMVKWLVRERDMDKEKAELLARMSAGSIGRALTMSGGNFLDKRQLWMSRLINLIGLSREKGFEMATECAEEAKKMDLETNEDGEAGILDMLTLWESWYRDLLILYSGDPTHLLMNVDFYDKLKKTVKYFRIENLTDSLFTIDQALRDLKRNRNTKLVMEHTVLGLRHLASVRSAKRIG